MHVGQRQAVHNAVVLNFQSINSIDLLNHLLTHLVNLVVGSELLALLQNSIDASSCLALGVGHERQGRE